MLKFYRNKNSYFIQSTVNIDTSKLKGVTVITSEKEAERQFREVCGMDEDDGVYIPSVSMIDGVLHGTSLNDIQFKINTSAEDYINNYNL